MANWSGFVLTDVGAKLQAKINAGLTTLKFTKLGIGSGSGSVNALTAMVNKVQDINIGSVKANNNIVTINSTLTNKGLGTAYQMRELGLFATDPDVGEILFAYMTDNTPDTMPADGSATVVSQDITLNITFSNTGKVSATIDTGAFVTHEDLNTHNSTEDAHSAAFGAHNTDEQAHDNRFNAIIQQVNTMITTTDDALIEHRESGIIDHPDGSVTTPKLHGKAVTLDKLADEVVGTILKKSDIQVITGEVANGGTIPLPNGFLESECKWFAGIKHSNVNEWRIDPKEGNRSNLLAPICTLNGRVVTVGTQVAGLDGGSYTQDGTANFGQAWARAFMPGTAWYMCIGIHG